MALLDPEPADIALFLTRPPQGLDERRAGGVPVRSMDRADLSSTAASGCDDNFGLPVSQQYYSLTRASEVCSCSSNTTDPLRVAKGWLAKEPLVFAIEV